MSARCRVSATTPRPAKAASPCIRRPITRCWAVSCSRVCSARTMPNTTGSMNSRWLGFGAMLSRTGPALGPPSCDDKRLLILLSSATQNGHDGGDDDSKGNEKSIKVAGVGGFAQSKWGSHPVTTVAENLKTHVYLTM